jgi:threonine/homoserine/homoserine lactone efflux protein
MQSLVLGAIAVSLDFLVQLLYIAAGGILSKALSRGPVKRWFERGVGGAFLALAAAAALVHRA